MSDRIKRGFDGIHAEDGLKRDTMLFLQNEIKKRKKPDHMARYQRLAVIFAAVFVMFFSGVSAYGLYFTPSAYVDVDVNPSLEIALNRFDRVIDTYAYNSEGAGILGAVDIKHKNYAAAISILIDAMHESGFTKKEGLISVTLQSNGEREDIMLSNIEACVADHHGTAQLDIFAVDSTVKDMAHDLNLSPAKYLAIEALLEVAPGITMDSCRNHSIGEIRQLTKKHTGGHHNAVPDETITPEEQGMPGNRGHNNMRHH